MARSVVFNGTSSASTVSLPNSSPYSAIGDFRLELRAHDLAAQTGTIWRNDHYALNYTTASTRLDFFNLATAESVFISISGKTDFIVRCRRVSSTGEISIEVWDADGTNRVASTTTVATTGTKNWSTTTSYSFCIGATREPDTSTYSWEALSIAWFRIRDASGSYNAAAPTDADAVGNLLSYEFEDNLNDTSGNTQNLTAVGSPTYATTPGSSGPPDPPDITLTPTSGQIEVDGSSADTDSYKIFRRTIQGTYNYSNPIATPTTLPYNDTTIINDRRYFYEVRATNAFGDSASSAEKVASFHTTTVVDTENAETGTSGWQLSNPAAAREIEGYANLTSVNKGSSIDFHIYSTQTNYTIDIYRMGYYAGLGGRQIGTQISKTNGATQTMPTAERNNTTPSLSRELVTCAWTSKHTYTVPSDAVSGIYLAKLTQTTSTKQSYIIFCVRDDSRSAEMLYIQPVTTYQAYNNWGGKSLYTLNSISVADTSDPLYGIVMNSAFQARAVSFSRPYAVTNRATRTNALKGIGAGDFLTTQDSDLAESSVNASGWELDTVMWLEQQGFDLKYVTNVDQHTTPSVMTSADVIVSVGHDEYWSQEMRDNIIAARDAGVHLNFLGANSAYWQIRFEDSNRTVVAWKEQVQDDDDVSDLTLKTALWRYDVNEPSRTGRPEEAFVGVMWKGYNINTSLKVSTPSNWIYQGLTVTDGQTLGTGLVGYEYDMIWDEGGASPDGLVTVFLNNFGTGDDHKGTVYEHISGAIVFATGTNQFAWGLFSNPLAVTGFRTDRTQTTVKHLMLNVLDAQLNSELEVSGVALFRGRNFFPLFDDAEVNRFEFWPAITVAGGTTVTPGVASLTTATFAPTVGANNNVTVIPATASLTTATFATKVNLAVIPSPASLTTSSFAPKLAETTTPSTAALTTATFAPNVLSGNQIVVTPGTATLTTTAFAPVLALKVIPNTATITTTTFAPVLPKQAVPGTASLTTATFAPTVSVSNNVSVVPSTATLTTAAFVPQLRLAVIPSTASLITTGFAPAANVGNSISVTPGVASLTTSTFAPNVNVSNNISVIPDTASLTTSRFAPVLRLAVIPSTASLTTSTFAPAVNAGNSISVTPATLSTSLSTFAPTVATTAHVTVTPGTLAVTTARFAPVLAFGVTPATSSLTTSTFAPTVSVTQGVTVTPGTLVLTVNRFNPIVNAGGNLTFEPGLASLVMTGHAPAVLMFYYYRIR